MGGIAKFTIINGRLAADAELKYIPDGLAVCSFTVAADSLRKKETKKDGQEGKKTYWVKCTLFGRQAETMIKYLLKGTAVYIDGNFDIDDWTSREGESRYTIQCNVQTIQLLGGTKGDAEGNATSDTDSTPQSSPTTYTPTSNPSSAPKDIQVPDITEPPLSGPADEDVPF